MSALARLKRELADKAQIPLATSEGFEGARPGGFSPDKAASLPIFSTERKEKLRNQFYMDPQNPQKGRAGGGAEGQTCPGEAPPKPAKGSDEGTAASVTLYNVQEVVHSPADWRRAFYMLSSVDALCPGFRLSMDWRETFDAAHAFLEQHADTAHALGWSALELFAVHREVGAVRVDCCGAVMLMAGSRVASIDRDVMALVRLRDGQPCGRIFRSPVTPEMILVWEFAR